MKKSIFYIAAAALALASCNEEELVNVNIPQGNKTLTASFEQDPSTSRMDIATDGNALTWSEGDEIAVISNDGDQNCYILSSGKGTAEGVFTPNLSDSETEVVGVKAAFPYANVNVYEQNDALITFDLFKEKDLSHLPEAGNTKNCNLPMLGAIENGAIAFKHLAGVLKVNLTNIPAGYNALTVTASNPISGEFKVSTPEGASDPVLVSESTDEKDKTVTVTFAEATEEANNEVLYLPLPVGTYESIVVSVSNGSQTITLKNWTNKTVVRAKVYSTSADVDTYVTTESALRAAVENGGTVNLGSDITITTPLVISAAVTLNGNNFTIENTTKGTDARAINVNVDGNVEIKNLKVIAAGERAINVIQKPATLTLDNVTATAANYALNVATSAVAAKVNVSGSTLTGLNTVNIAGPNAEVIIQNSTINTVDNNEAEGYSSLCLNKDAVDGKIVVTNSTINITGSHCDNTAKATNQTENGTITIDGSIEEVDIDVAYISYGTNWYGFTTIDGAIAKANAGEEIVLLRNIELSEAITIPAGKNIVLNLNGKTISQEKTCEESYSMITNKGTLKIKGNGTISFKDLSNGGGADWGSYVITNNGTLVVEGGTLKHFGSADGDHDTNLPIQNYKGKVTINGGTISSVDFRSLRDFTAGGEVIINGGKFEGQVWMQGLGNGSSSLTINGGEFEPVSGYDGSSVYINNGTNDIVMSVTGGMFNTKIGCAQPTRTGATQSVTGGTFTQTAKEYTNPQLLAIGYVFKENENGTFDVVLPQSE